MSINWPADRRERRAVADLKPYDRNARTHSPEQIAQLARAIEEWGWTTPILIDGSNRVIAGHGRLAAAKNLGIKEVPVTIAEGWSEAQVRAYVIADNQIALNAGWDEDLLRIEIGEIKGLDFDLGLMGFGDDDLARFIDAGGEAEDSADAEGPSLQERFGIAPFSVMNAREGWWQDRKRAWLALGIQSELGRGEGDRACPGGSPMPGRGSRKDYGKPGKAEA